jgi:hypothetical protein
MVRPLASDDALHWVTRYLAEYCMPGAHRYAVAVATRWCTSCYKEESLGGDTCMICDLRGSDPGVLALDGGL